MTNEKRIIELLEVINHNLEELRAWQRKFWDHIVERDAMHQERIEEMRSYEKRRDTQYCVDAAHFLQQAGWKVTPPTINVKVERKEENGEN